MTDIVTAEYNLNFCSDAEIEARIDGLKLLAGHMANPIDRLRCLREILRMRSAHLRAQMARSPSPEATGVLNTLPASPSREQAGELSVASARE